MAGTRLSAWDPSNADQFAIFSSQLELWKVSSSAKQRVAHSISISRTASHVSCLDWQKVENNAFLAYGSTTGNIGLIKWGELMNQEVLLHEATTAIKRACNGLAWSFVTSTELATCVESYKK